MEGTTAGRVGEDEMVRRACKMKRMEGGFKVKFELGVSWVEVQC